MPNAQTLLKDMSLDEMLDLRAKIEARVSTLAADEVAALETRLEKLKGFVDSTEAAPAPQKAAKPAKRVEKVKAAGKRGPKKGQKVAPKFRDPESGKTWTGRGLSPLWLREHEAKGGKREDFAI